MKKRKKQAKGAGRIAAIVQQGRTRRAAADPAGLFYFHAESSYKLRKKSRSFGFP
jgi:hypothetical protein